MSRFPVLGPRDRSHWFRIGTIDVTTTTLVTALACVSLILFAISSTLLEPLQLDTQAVGSGQVWRLLSWPFVNDLLSGTIWIVLAIVVFWWLGQRLEQTLGPRRCLLFYAILALVPALAITVYGLVTGQDLTQSSLLGSGMYDLEVAVLVAYAAAFPRVRFFFNIEAWVITIVFIAIDLLLFAEERAGTAAIYLLITAAVALLATRAFRLTRAQWIPTIPLPASVTGDAAHRRERQRKKSARAAHLRIVRETDINAILDKISESGINSLSREERQRLDEYGRGPGR
jgi:membrane associated rhomboid family serine protease